MARGKGSANFSGNLEVLAGAPLDAREKVATLADLTAEGSFPYFYVGMETYVVSENKKYRLVGDDPTDIEDWEEVGSGSGASSMSDLTDVNITNIDDGEGLLYDETTEKFVNRPVYTKTQVDNLINSIGNILPDTDSSRWVASSGTTINSSGDYAIDATFTEKWADYRMTFTQTEREMLSGKNILVKVNTAEFVGCKIELVINGSNFASINSEGEQILGTLPEVTDANIRVVANQTSETWSAKITGLNMSVLASSEDIGVEDLEDVELTSLTDGQILKWDATAQKWINSDGGSSDSIQVSEMPTASASLEGAVVQYIGTTTGSYTHNYFYECVSDGESTPTYSWEQTNVQPSGGSGSASLETAVTSNLAVGAIPSGTTLPQGTTFTEFAQKLLISEIAPTVGFSISKSGNVVYGGSYTETLTVNVSAMGTAKKIKKIEWYEGSTLKQTDTIDSTTTGSWTYTMGTATTDSTTFKAIVTYTKSDDTDTSVTKTASINFYYNKFYGAVSSLTPDEATVEALTSALATGKGGTYSFTTSASRMCYAYPKSLGALTSIKDGNGFSLFDSFTRTEQTYTQNGTNVVYYRYVLTDPTTVSSYSVIFA